jgi:phosphatidylinositol alpha-1,6-mannosyltransferase
VHLAIGGSGRDEGRLRRRAEKLGGRAHFLGRISEDDLPAVYASADVFTMLCRDRWAGLEAEGFGIVFLEAAAVGVPVVAGDSGGSAEAVIDQETGIVVESRDVKAVRHAIERLLSDTELHARMSAGARRRAEHDYSYDVLVQRLAPLAAGDLSVLEVTQ